MADTKTLPPEMPRTPETAPVEAGELDINSAMEAARAEVESQTAGVASESAALAERVVKNGATPDEAAELTRATNEAVAARRDFDVEVDIIMNDRQKELATAQESWRAEQDEAAETAKIFVPTEDISLRPTEPAPPIEQDFKSAMLAAEPLTPTIPMAREAQEAAAPETAAEKEPAASPSPEETGRVASAAEWQRLAAAEAALQQRYAELQKIQAAELESGSYDETENDRALNQAIKEINAVHARQKGLKEQATFAAAPPTAKENSAEKEASPDPLEAEPQTAAHPETPKSGSGPALTAEEKVAKLEAGLKTRREMRTAMGPGTSLDDRIPEMEEELRRLKGEPADDKQEPPPQTPRDAEPTVEEPAPAPAQETAKPEPEPPAAVTSEQRSPEVTPQPDAVKEKPPVPEIPRDLAAEALAWMRREEAQWRPFEELERSTDPKDLDELAERLKPENLAKEISYLKDGLSLNERLVGFLEGEEKAQVAAEQEAALTRLAELERHLDTATIHAETTKAVTETAAPAPDAEPKPATAETPTVAEEGPEVPEELDDAMTAWANEEGVSDWRPLTDLEKDGIAPPERLTADSLRKEAGYLKRGVELHEEYAKHLPADKQRGAAGLIAELQARLADVEKRLDKMTPRASSEVRTKPDEGGAADEGKSPDEEERLPDETGDQDTEKKRLQEAEAKLSPSELAAVEKIASSMQGPPEGNLLSLALRVWFSEGRVSKEDSEALEAAGIPARPPAEKGAFMVVLGEKTFQSLDDYGRGKGSDALAEASKNGYAVRKLYQVMREKNPDEAGHFTARYLEAMKKALGGAQPDRTFERLMANRQGGAAILEEMMDDINTRLALGQELPPELEMALMNSFDVLSSYDEAAVPVYEQVRNGTRPQEDTPRLFLTDAALQRISDGRELTDAVFAKKLRPEDFSARVAAAYEAIAKKHGVPPPKRREPVIEDSSFTF